MFKRLSTEIAFACAITSMAVVFTAAFLARISIVPTVSAAALAGVLAYIIIKTLLVHRVARSITEVSQALARAANGERVEVRVKGRNETADLATSFNLMSDRMAERDVRIARLAFEDEATGLPNARAMEGRLANMRAINDPDTLFAVIVGIDNFAALRLAIGDALCARLVGAIANRLSATYGEISVGCSGPDRIATIFRAESADAATQTAAAIAAIASQPTWLNDDRIEVTVTTGLACHADAQHVPLSLLQRAEAALARARSTHFGTPILDGASPGDPVLPLQLMRDLMLGLGRGEFFLVHQPKFDLRKRTVLAATSTPRWRHPSMGLLTPDHFMAIAAATGHIRPLTEWWIDCAITEQRRMREAGRDITLSITIPASLMANPQFAERAQRQIRRTGARLCFEIIGAVAADEEARAIEIMKDLRDTGVGVSIGDYGASPFSLASLRAIPARELKIDPMFIATMARGNAGDLLLKSVIDLGHSLGMAITADGVETGESLNLLQSMGADAAQGTIIASPMPLAEFVKFEPAVPAAARQATTLKSLG